MVNFRKAKESDLIEIQSLARATIDACYRAFLGDESVDGFLNSGESDKEVEKNLLNCTVLEIDGSICGYCVNEADFIHILMISPTLQRGGFGSKLLTHIEQNMKDSGYSRFSLETFRNNDQAVNFYLKNGWVVDREEHDENFGFTRIYLTKSA